jgi:hypothetical protein
MLTERMMRAAVWRLVDRNQELSAGDLARMDEPWRSIYLYVLTQADSHSDREDALMAAIGTSTLVDRKRPNYWDLVNSEIDRMELADKGRRYRSFKETKHELETVDWTWPLWLPKGMITVIGGFPGTGKSWFVLDLARSVIHGGNWPDGKPVTETGPVVWVEGEGIPQVVMQREEALQLDDSQLYMLHASEGSMLDLASEMWRDELIELVGAVRPRLVIVDSLRSVSLNGTDRAEQVNPLLLFLSGVARFANCSVVIVHHLRKPSGSQQAFPLVTIHDFAGSGHIIALARTAIGLSVMQNGNGFSLRGPRRVDLCKTFEDYPEPLGVTLESLPGGGKRMVYGEAPNADTTARQDCGSWLIEYLEEHGASKVKDVVADALEAGYSRDMVYRARKELETRIVNTKGHKHPQNRWALFGEESQNGEESEESQGGGGEKPREGCDSSDSRLFAEV